jgi:hypothetical protein
LPDELTRGRHSVSKILRSSALGALSLSVAPRGERLKKDRAAWLSLGGPVYLAVFPGAGMNRGRTEKGRRF